jgi:hypothetical protein
MQNASNPADGKFVVVQNGQRVTAPTENQREAQQEAERRNKVQESTGKAVPEGQKAQVKQNLYG